MTPGEAAYTKWCECINTPRARFVDDKLDLQPWAKLKRRERSIWHAVAAAAIEANR